MLKSLRTFVFANLRTSKHPAKKIWAMVAALFGIPVFGEGKIFVVKGTAINGYDAVAYFTKQEPVKGNPAFSTNWRGAVWLFSSEQNLQLFNKDPEKYAPVFGGFCALGVSRGYTVATDPRAWTIVGDRLYLNYSLLNKEQWLKDRDKLITIGEKNWLGWTSQNK